MATRRPAPKSYNGVTYQTGTGRPGQRFGTVGNFLVVGDLDRGSRRRSTPTRATRSATTATSRTRSATSPTTGSGTLYTVPKNFIEALGPPVRPAAAAAARADRRRQPGQAGRRRADGHRGHHPARGHRRQQRRRHAGELADRRRPRAVLARPRHRQPRRHRQAGASTSSRIRSRTSTPSSADPADHRLVARPAHGRARRLGPLRPGDHPVDPDRGARSCSPRTPT